MSLTWHLRNHLESPAGDYLQRKFPHPKRITLNANKQLEWSGKLLPSTPYCPFRTLSIAINYRIHYSFAITPTQKLPAWRGAFEHLAWNAGYDDVSYLGGPYTLHKMESFFESLEATLNVLLPVRRILDREEEQVLARYCFVLALFEEVNKSKSFRYSPLAFPRLRKNVDDFLAIPREEWIDDLCRLMKLFYEQFAHLLVLPHVLNPAFQGCSDIGPSEADLIVDGCLIVIKANVEQWVQSLWLRHLAGCVLLDYDDLFHINFVGIYLARRGKLLRWPLDEFLRLLSGEATISISTLRNEFRTRCQQTCELMCNELL
jgi:hypothetical protein